LLVLIVTPIVAVLLMVTVIGFYLGLILFSIYLLLILLASGFLLFYTGNLVYGWYNKNGRPSLMRDLLLGTLICLILSFIPIIGWLAVMILFLIALGSLSTWFKREQLS
jgi:hypothetical protein